MDEFGWGRFFLELSRVINSSENHIGANERFARYIIERLENGLRNVYAVNEILTIGCEPENELEPEEEEVICRYKRMTDELSSCVLSLLCYWDTYLDELESNSSEHTGYQAEVIHNPMTRGRLTGIIQQLRYNNPYCGETMMMGHLRAMGCIVTRDRVRSVVRRIDPLNSALRWGGDVTSRRPYSVPGPNSLWHLGT